MTGPAARPTEHWPSQAGSTSPTSRLFAPNTNVGFGSFTGDNSSQIGSAFWEPHFHVLILSLGNSSVHSCLINFISHLAI